MSDKKRFEAVSPGAIAARLTELWSPRVVGAVDDNYVKVARLSGEFGWHAHDNEDEMFLVLKGRLRIQMEEGDVEIGEGEFYVVPKGVRHNPVAAEEVHVMLFERKTTAYGQRRHGQDAFDRRSVAPHLIHLRAETDPRVRAVAERLRIAAAAAA